MKKNLAESHAIIMNVYGEHGLAERIWQEWFARFKSGGLSLEDKERSGRSNKFDYKKLETLLDADC